MSSMFKKKGGLAFKPKLAAARPRPPVASSATAAKIVERQPSIDSTSEIVSSRISVAEKVSSPSTTPSAGPQSSEETQQTSSIRNDAPTTTESQSSVDPPESNLVPLSNDSVPVTDSIHSASHLHGETAVDTALRNLQSAIDSEHSTQIQESTVVASTSSTVTLSDDVTSTSAEQLQPSQNINASAPGLEVEPQFDPATDTPPIESSLPKAPPRAPSSRKKRTTVAEVTADGEDAVEKLTKRPRRKATKAGNDAAPKPRTRKRKASADADAGDDAETSATAKRRPRKARSPTPEDAEDQVVDLQQLRMADLTKDLRIGKKFSRHDELRERERRARAKAKKDGGQDEDEASGSASPKPDEAAKAKVSGSNLGEPTASTSAAAAGPQFRIVDGQIVLDQSSLVMDRHARAAAAQGDMETIEENDFTRLITSQSFMTSSKLKGPNVWTDDETELFYRGLRMFGTDFEMISKFFPNKQRRHVKLKFNREERRNSARVDAALIGEKTIKMDIDEYRAFTGAEFEPVETIEAEQRKIQESYEEEQQRVADEQAEIMRKKREALFADDGDAGGGKKKKSKKKGKQAVVYGLNGEPIAQDE